MKEGKVKVGPPRKPTGLLAKLIDEAECDPRYYLTMARMVLWAKLIDAKRLLARIFKHKQHNEQ